ncbi:MAG: hypothetical protein AB7S44_01575 [Spirochaetales bacterium]
MTKEEFLKHFDTVKKEYEELAKLKKIMLDLQAKNLVDFGSFKTQYDDAMIRHTELNARLWDSMTSLKEEFVTNNNTFTNYFVFQGVLDFFNTYAIMENLTLFKVEDYAKLNLDFLRQYQQGLNGVYVRKEKQYQDICKDLKGQEDYYLDFYMQPITEHETTSPRALNLQVRHKATEKNKTLSQMKVNAIKKTLDTLDQVLGTAHTEEPTK